jgi:hypothetical protein
LPLSPKAPAHILFPFTLTNNIRPQPPRARAEPAPPAIITSIDSTTRLAQKQFNRWLDLDDIERTPFRLIEMLGFDYFTLLDALTIARSRKHIERYYGIQETGRNLSC